MFLHYPSPILKIISVLTNKFILYFQYKTLLRLSIKLTEF